IILLPSPLAGEGSGVRGRCQLACGHCSPHPALSHKGRGSLGFLFRSFSLKTEDHLANLDSVSVLQRARIGYCWPIHFCLLRCCSVVQYKFVAVTADECMALLDFHVAEQGDVGGFVAAQLVICFVEWILTPLLPAAQDAHRRRLEHTLH